jgi:hypothetical protein
LYRVLLTRVSRYPSPSCLRFNNEHDHCG